ncbi:MAG: serine hydrolase [Thermomicrobiales bacterium]|nr:serine hydrolase [Thermomicrobiales bacterium]
MSSLPARWQPLAAFVSQHEAAPVRIGISVQAPDGDRFSLRGDERFISASTIKIPIMVEIYRQIDRGHLTIDDRFTLTPEDICPGSGVLLQLHPGIELTLRDIIYLMMSISDNTATNMLIDLAGMENVNEVIASLGMTHSELGRKMRGVPAQPGDPENWGAPNDFRAAIDAILTGTAASPESCAQMVEMLILQQNSRRIGRSFPEGTLPWGSKTGTVGDVSHDAGFVRGPNGDLIVIVFTQGFPILHDAEPVMGEIARLAAIASGLLS